MANSVAPVAEEITQCLDQVTKEAYQSCSQEKVSWKYAAKLQENTNAEG